MTKILDWIRSKMEHVLLTVAGCLIVLEVVMPWFWDWMFGAALFGLFWLVVRNRTWI